MLRRVSGSKIRAAREAAGIGVVELAEKVGVTYSAISHMENGTKTLSANIIIAIAGILDVPLDDLTETVSG
jgi:transcriptional regulator with XRE-family HTH domain